MASVDYGATSPKLLSRQCAGSAGNYLVVCSRGNAENPDYHSGDRDRCRRVSFRQLVWCQGAIVFRAMRVLRLVSGHPEERNGCV